MLRPSSADMPAPADHVARLQLLGEVARGGTVAWKPIDMDEQSTTSPIVMLYRTDGQNEKAQGRFIEYVRRFCCPPEEP